MSAGVDPATRFHEAVQHMEQGESLQQVLRRYPGYERELRPLLELVELLRSFPAVPGRQADQIAQTKQRVMDQFARVKGRVVQFRIKRLSLSDYISYGHWPRGFA